MRRTRKTRTETTKRVQTVFDLVCNTGRVGLLTGPAGTGKTTALRMIAESEPDAVRMMKFDTTARSVTGFLLSLTALYGIRTAKRSERDLNAVCRDVFANEDDSPAYSTVLVIDEAQHADERTLRHILTFNEDFGLPILLSGNEEVLKRTRSSAAAFAQINTRIAFRLELTGPTRADIAAFCVDYNVAFADQAKLIEFGITTSARQFCLILETAQMLAQSGPVKFEHISDALQSLSGPLAARELLAFSGGRKRSA